MSACMRTREDITQIESYIPDRLSRASLEELDKAEDDISQYCHQMLLKYR